MIIDDDEVIGILLHEWLKDKRLAQYNIESTYLTNCSDALKLAETRHFDLILMDVNMPYMDGHKGTKLFQKAHPNIKIVAISASSDTLIQEKMLLAGAYDYIHKPLVFSLFIKRIDTYMKILLLKNHQSIIHEEVSLFKEVVSNYKISFMIKNEEDLLAFWDAILTRFHLEQYVEKIHDTIANIYNFGLISLPNIDQFSIIIQENDFHCYITIESSSQLKSELLKGFYPNEMFHFDNNKMVIKLEKTDKIETKVVSSESSPTPLIHHIETVVYDKVDEVVQVFTLFDHDEMDDLENYLYKLPSIMDGLREGFDVVLMDRLCLTLGELGTILVRYTEVETFYRNIVDFISILEVYDGVSLEWEDVFVLMTDLTHPSSTEVP